MNRIQFENNRLQKIQTFTLTANADTIVGTTGSDTVTGTSATVQAGDSIIDQTTTDNDVLNLTLTAANAAARVAGIETVNVNWDAFADATFVATNVTGAKVALTSAKTGFLGNATITDAGANTIEGGAGMNNALTVNGATGVTVNAGQFKTVTVNGAASTTDTATVVAGDATTSVVIAATVEKAATITTSTATATVTSSAITTTVGATNVKSGATVTINGTTGTTDAATVTTGADITVDISNANFAGTEKLTLNVADGKVVTVNGKVAANVVEVAGSGAATLKSTAANITGDTVTKSNTGSLTVTMTDAALAATVDTSKIDATSFNVTAGVGAVLTAKTGQNFNVAAAAATATVAVGVATDGTADTATLNLTSARYAAITQGANDIETLTINASAPAITGADLTIDSLTQGGNTLMLTGTNDVAIAAVTPGTIDANALVGTLTLGGTTALASGSVNGASGVNTISFGAVLADTAATFVGQAGNDVVTIATTAIVGGGTVEGRATFVTGDGNDTVNVTGVSAGTLTVNAGNGNDTVSLAATATGQVNLTFGEGTDTLKLANSVNLPNATSTISGLEVITLTGAAVSIDAALISGTTYTVNSSGVATGYSGATLTVNGAATASTIDLSGLVASDSATTGAKISIVGGAAADVIKGTSIGDTIEGGTGADTLTGGAGADTFVVAAQTTAAGIDWITDFVGGTDKLKTGITPVTAVLTDLTASDFSSAANLAAAATNAVTAAEAASAGNYASAGDAVTFKFGGKTYITVNDGTDSTFTDDGTDVLVEITGITGTLVIGDIIA